MSHFKLDDVDIEGKRILVRIGTDVPVDEEGNILDDMRINLSIPTLKAILEKVPSKLILMCHMGRPKNNEHNLRTDNVALRISEILGEEVAKIDNWGEDGLPDSRIIFLENVRFNKAEKSEDIVERDNFGKQLSGLADVFVQDAFSNSHHDQASMTSIPKFIISCAGLLVEKEISTIKNALDNPQRPFISLIGGLKAEKLNAVKNMLEKADHILIAGALAFTVLKAEGHEMGASKIDAEGLEKLKDLVEEIRSNEKVVLPTDAVIADKFDAEAESKVVSIDSIPHNWLALDIGPESVKKYCEIISNAKTIVWNGPIGVFEFEKFAQGTKDIANAIVASGAKVIVGGGNSAEAIYKMGLGNKITHVSSGGGASLQLFEGKKLVAIEALEANFTRFSH